MEAQSLLMLGPVTSFLSFASFVHGDDNQGLEAYARRYNGEGEVSVAFVPRDGVEVDQRWHGCSETYESKCPRVEDYLRCGGRSWVWVQKDHVMNSHCALPLLCVGLCRQVLTEGSKFITA